MNKITKHPLLVAILVIMGIAVSACLPDRSPNPTQSAEQVQTAAAQTLDAMLTQASFTLTSAASVFTATPSPTDTPIPPSATPFPTLVPPTATAVTRCDWVGFVSDVTFPDGSPVAASASFTKTWRLKNIGSCTWSTGYEIVYIEGSKMGGVTTKLPASIAPGQTVDVSVKLVAPETPGAYRGYWMLRNSAGVTFGTGPQAAGSLFVDVKVTNTAFTAYTIFYNFAVNYCSASWSSEAAALTCPGTIGDSSGYVVKLDSPNLEDGSLDNEPALLTHPQDITNGYITGIFPVIDVVLGDRFQAIVGCQFNSSTCDVLFKLEYQVSGSSTVQPLASWHEVYEKKFQRVDVDLSSLAGQSVQFILTVQANGTPAGDDALWFMPRLVRPKGLPATNVCSLVSQTPANNVQLAPRTDFDVTWTIKNTGPTTWDRDNVDFIYLAGTWMHKFGGIYDLSASVAPNSTLKLVLDMLAPATAGTYTETWGLRNGSNIICVLNLTIQVK